MRIKINRKFLKELAALPEKDRKKIEQFVFEDSINFQRLHDVVGIKKLQGHQNYYRIRFGDYRAGLKYEKDTLTFERLLHRKDIYKYYP
jgi:mRNA interferase RelE/StbE